MKVALCLQGLVGGTVGKDGKGETLDPRIAYDAYKKHIIDPNEADVFFHSWSVDEGAELIGLYNPKKARAEERKPFCGQLEGPDYRFHSRWYSSKMAIQLKKEYEEEHGFKYDAVMVSRLDVAFYTDLIFSDYDLNKFWASNWNGVPGTGEETSNHMKGSGFLDLWFFSNSHIMDQFGALYDNIDDYETNAHIASCQHAKTITDQIGYTLYRWKDHEVVRRKLGAKE